MLGLNARTRAFSPKGSNGSSSPSEFMASNNSTMLDGDGVAWDWIEIYNKGDQAVNLAGYSLTDNLN
jgi:hypothetical protein